MTVVKSDLHPPLSTPHSFTGHGLLVLSGAERIVAFIEMLAIISKNF